MVANPSVFTARLFLKAGKVEEAIALLEPIVRTNAADHAAWYQLALAQSQQRRFFPALKTYATYTNGLATLLVDTDVTRNIT